MTGFDRPHTSCRFDFVHLPRQLPVIQPALCYPKKKKGIRFLDALSKRPDSIAGALVSPAPSLVEEPDDSEAEPDDSVVLKADDPSAAPALPDDC